MVAADLDVTVDLARALLAEQHPDLASLGLEIVANGWDNVMVRAGDDLALRLPRREIAARLVVNEQLVLPVLAPRLPVPTPLPVRTGVPSEALGYPWAWSVVPWLGGTDAASLPAAARTPWAADLARVFVALHQPAPADAPENRFRGIPLSVRSEAFAERLHHLPEHLHEPARALWTQVLEAPEYDGEPVWLHGDPHPGNLVVDGGRLAAMIDFGDVTSGDPASDLGTAWLTFDAEGRKIFRAAVDAGARDGHGWDTGMWHRAEGWALLYSAVLLTDPEEHPLMARVGEHALEQLFG